MARTKAYLAPINQGEVSPVALARVDIQRMQGACELLENITPMVEGALRFRAGSVYSGIRTRNDAQAVVKAFQASSTQTALLEFTPNIMRAIVNGVLVERPAVSTVWSNPDFLTAISPWVVTADTDCSGAITGAGGMTLTATRLGKASIQRTMTVGSIGVEHAFRISLQSHPLRFRVGTATQNDDVFAQTTLLPGWHSLAFTPTAGTVYVTIEAVEEGVAFLAEVRLESAGPMEVPTVYGAGQLSSLRMDQSADVIFVADGQNRQQRIERRSMRSWSVAEYSSNNGPFTNERPPRVFLSATGQSGTVAMNATAPIFSAANVGQLIEITHNKQNIGDRLYAEGHATLPIKITGFGTQRGFSFSITGLTGSGTRVSLTRSLAKEGPYNDYSNGAYSYTTDLVNSGLINDTLDGREIYYRLEIPKGGYSTGSPIGILNTTSGSQRGIAIVRAVNSPTQASCEVLARLGDTSATDDWRFGDWSPGRGWPSSLTLHDGRLFFGRRDSEYGSVSDDYSNFDQDTIGDSAPIVRSAGVGPVEGSLWMVALQRLINGSAASIRSIRSSSFDSPLTAANYLGRDIATRGSAALSPLKMDASAVYVTRDYRRALEIAYSVDANDYTISNLTRLARHILPGQQVVDAAVQRHPETRLWFVLADGTARILTYDKDEQVAAWSRYVTDGVIETMTVIPTALGSELWMVVRRTVEGQTRRFIERQAFDVEAEGAASSVMSDCSVVYSGSAATEIDCAHLNGRQVVVWADGRVIHDADAPVTVTANKVTLATAASNVVIGLPYRGWLKGSKCAFGGQMGTAVSQRKQANAASPLLVQTAIGGIRMGSDFNRMTRLNEVVDGRVIDTAAVIESYDIDPQVIPTWAKPDYRFHMAVKSPYPMTLAGLVLDVLTHES